MDYTTLVAAKSTAGSIKDWVNADTVPSTAILTDAQAFIYSRLRVRQMMVSASGSLVVDQAYIALPTGYRDTKRFGLTGIYKAELTGVLIDELEDSYVYDDSGRVSTKPKCFAPDATQLLFDSPPDVAYPYLWRYYGTPTALSGANETNFLTDTYPRILRMACVGFANEFMKDDEERAYWLALCVSEINQANAEGDLESRQMRVTPE